MWFATLEPGRLRVDQIEVFQVLINIKLSIKKWLGNVSMVRVELQIEICCAQKRRNFFRTGWFSPLSTMVGHPGMIRGNTENQFPSWQTDTCPDSA